MKQIASIILSLVLIAFCVQPVYAQELLISDPSAKPIALVASVDERPTILKGYLNSKHSPAAESASFFVSEADRLNLDWRLVAAISGVESTFCKHIPTGSYNCWGWGVFTGQQDGIHFADWNDGITKVSEGLRYKYIDKGANTIEEIGRIYAASPVWASKVKWMYGDIMAFRQKSVESLAVTI